MISIIVPVYNAAPYLCKCIDSVLAQSVGDFELLLVNDGSTDSSLEICRSYAGRDGRVRVFDIPNGGVSGARNYGIERSEGEYLMFMDADDWLTPDALEVCTPYIPQYDMVRFSACAVYDDHVFQYELGSFDSVEEAVGAVIARKTIVACWGALFRRELFIKNGIRFDTSLNIGEDWLVTACLTGKSRLIKFLPGSYCYCYNRTNEGSCTRNVSEDKVLTQLRVCSVLRRIYPSGYDREFSYTRCMLVMEMVYGFGKDAARRALAEAGIKLGLGDIMRVPSADMSFKLKSRLLRFWLYVLLG